MIRRPPRSTLDRSSAASDVYKRQVDEVGDDEEVAGIALGDDDVGLEVGPVLDLGGDASGITFGESGLDLSLIHISEPTRPY